MIPSRSWGLNPGSQSVLYPRDGHIVLGGYDENSVNDSFVEYDISHSISEGPEGHVCSLQVTIESMSLKPVGMPDVSLLTIRCRLQIVSSRTWLPPQYLKQ
jgi:hypothetical protein